MVNMNFAEQLMLVQEEQFEKSSSSENDLISLNDNILQINKETVQHFIRHQHENKNK